MLCSQSHSSYCVLFRNKVTKINRGIPQWHRFFLIFCLTFILPAVFLFGITIVPLVCGLKAIFSGLGKPEAPKRPAAPAKPDKPLEPNIGAKQQEWDQYRAKLEEYRAQKKTWKQKSEKYKGRERDLLDAYYEKQKDYKEKYGEDAGKNEKSCMEFIKEATFHMLFCRKERPKLLIWFIKRYSNDL